MRQVNQIPGCHQAPEKANSCVDMKTEVKSQSPAYQN